MRRIIHKVKGWISRAPAAKTDSIRFVYVLPTPRNGPPEFAPADQLAILRRLSSFAGRENVTVTAIFPGRPTKKMPDGSTSHGVTLRYALPDQLGKVVSDTVHSAGGLNATVLVTDDAALEKRAHASHGRTLRLATFEKTLEAVAGPLRKEQSEPRHSHPEQNRHAQAQPAAPQPAAATGQPPAAAAQPPAAAAQPQAAAAQPATEGVPEPKPRPQPAPQPSRKSKDTERNKDAAILEMIDPL